MPQRPRAIVVVSLCYLFSPLAIILSSSVFTNTPVIGPYTIFSKFAYSDWLVLAMYVASAVSVFMVKRWGWYTFMLASAYLVGYNLFVFCLRPQYSLLVTILLNLALALVAGTFFRRELIAPYFNPRIRWWEQATRYEIAIRAEVDTEDGIQSAHIIDISESGVFICCDGDLARGSEYPLSLFILRHSVRVDARVMRRAVHDGRSGYGFKFVRISAEQRSRLVDMLGDLERAGTLNEERLRRTGKGGQETMPRYRANTFVEIGDTRDGGRTVVLDLSENGCSVQSAHAPDEAVKLTLTCFNQDIDVPGRVRWSSAFRGYPSCGIVFQYENKRQKRLMAGIVRRARKARAPRRLDHVASLPRELIFKHAMNSPYRIVHTLIRKIRQWRIFSGRA